MKCDQIPKELLIRLAIELSTLHAYKNQNLRESRYGDLLTFLEKTPFLMSLNGTFKQMTLIDLGVLRETRTQDEQGILKYLHKQFASISSEKNGVWLNKLVKGLEFSLPSDTDTIKDRMNQLQHISYSDSPTDPSPELAVFPNNNNNSNILIVSTQKPDLEKIRSNAPPPFNGASARSLQQLLLPTKKFEDAVIHVHRNNNPTLSEKTIIKNTVKHNSFVYITGHGTSNHSGIAGAYQDTTVLLSNHSLVKFLIQNSDLCIGDTINIVLWVCNAGADVNSQAAQITSFFYERGYNANVIASSMPMERFFEYDAEEIERGALRFRNDLGETHQTRIFVKDSHGLHQYGIKDQVFFSTSGISLKQGPTQPMQEIIKAHTVPLPFLERSAPFTNKQTRRNHHQKIPLRDNQSNVNQNDRSKLKQKRFVNIKNDSKMLLEKCHFDHHLGRLKNKVKNLETRNHPKASKEANDLYDNLIIQRNEFLGSDLNNESKLNFSHNCNRLIDHAKAGELSNFRGYLKILMKIANALVLFCTLGQISLPTDSVTIIRDLQEALNKGKNSEIDREDNLLQNDNQLSSKNTDVTLFTQEGLVAQIKQIRMTLNEAVDQINKKSQNSRALGWFPALFAKPNSFDEQIHSSLKIIKNTLAEIESDFSHLVRDDNPDTYHEAYTRLRNTLNSEFKKISNCFNQLDKKNRGTIEAFDKLKVSFNQAHVLCASSEEDQEVEHLQPKSYRI